MERVSPHFTRQELACQHCGELPEEYGRELAQRLEELRESTGIPLPVTSGYRCLKHPVEARKPAGALHAHTTELAADIHVTGRDAFALLITAPLVGARGIGVKQHGDWDRRFLHIDWRKGELAVWSYPS